MDSRVLDVIIDSVQDCPLFDDKHTEVFEQYGQRVNRVSQLTDFFATMLRMCIIHLFLVKHLRIINALLLFCLLLAWAAMDFLHFHIVVFLHFAQFEGDILQPRRQNRLHVLTDYIDKVSKSNHQPKKIQNSSLTLLVWAHGRLRLAQFFQLHVALLDQTRDRSCKLYCLKLYGRSIREKWVLDPLHMQLLKGFH